MPNNTEYPLPWNGPRKMLPALLLGGLLVCVLPTRSNGQAGSLDTGFTAAANGTVSGVAVQSGGKIVLGGSFNRVDGKVSNFLARVNPDGSSDLVFDANSYIYAVVVQFDGRLLVGGYFTTIGATTHASIARINVDGNVDDNFNPGTDGGVFAIAEQDDGKIVFGGLFAIVNGIAHQNIARVNAAGVLDTSFNASATGGDYGCSIIVVQPDGRILLGGDFTQVNGTPHNHIARLNADGTIDGTFNVSADGKVYSIAVQPDGKIILGGVFKMVNGESRRGVARLTPDGSLEAGFSAVSFDFAAINTLALQPDGNILLGGLFRSINGDPHFGMARLNADGSLDTSFHADTALNGPTSTGAVDAIALQGDGKIVIGGDFSSINGTARSNVARLNGFTPSRLVGNVSTRLPVGTGDNVLIEGFIVQGTAGSTKKIIVRAIGPSLTGFGVTDALANPTLEIHDANNANAVVATNDDWRVTQIGGLITTDQSAQISASGLAPGNDLESAIIANLAPGNYTAVVRGAGNSVGTGVVDAYDISSASPANLANIATRGLIQPGDGLMIAGFIVQNAAGRTVVRAIGPSLAAFGITNALPDTTLQLRDVNGAIVVENDDWKIRSSDGSSQQAELEATHLQPTDDREAAVVTTLPPGQYTVHVRGKPETKGTGVVQVYFLP